MKQSLKTQRRREDAGIKHLNDSKAFIECSNTMDNVYENIDEYNPTRKKNFLIVFDDMIADIMINKKFHAAVKELFMRWSSKSCQTKLNSLFDYGN